MPLEKSIDCVESKHKQCRNPGKLENRFNTAPDKFHRGNWHHMHDCRESSSMINCHESCGGICPSRWMICSTFYKYRTIKDQPSLSDWAAWLRLNWISADIDHYGLRADWREPRIENLLLISAKTLSPSKEPELNIPIIGQALADKIHNTP